MPKSAEKFISDNGADVYDKVKINSKDFDEALNKVKNRLNEAEISEPEGGLYY